MNEIVLLVLAIFIPVIVITLKLQSYFKKFAIDALGELKGSLLSISMLILFGIAFPVIICEITIDQTVQHDPIKLLIYTSPLYLIGITVIWILIHYKIFTKQENEINILKNEILTLESPNMKIQAILNAFPNLLDFSPIMFLQQYANHIISLILLVVMLCIEIGLISVISQHKTNNYPASALYLIGFYIFAVPCFIILGTIISASILQNKKYYLIFILLITIGPTIGIMKLSFSLYSNDDTLYLGGVIGVGIPAAILY